MSNKARVKQKQDLTEQRALRTNQGLGTRPPAEHLLMHGFHQYILANPHSVSSRFAQSSGPEANVTCRDHNQLR